MFASVSRSLSACLRRSAPIPAVFILALCTTPAALADNPLDAFVAKFRASGQNSQIYHSNGRIEAQTVDVASKYAGRIDTLPVHEGDLLSAGDLIAQMDTREAQAAVNGAAASVLRAKAAKTIAEATLMQASSSLSVAQTNYQRTQTLFQRGNAAQSSLDDALNTLNGAKASVAVAKAQIEDATALIAESEASLEHARLALEDLTIVAPIRGRVLYRLHEPGEVVAAGYPLLTLLDLTNVYMNIYLPASVAGTLTINDEARLILDPIPDYVVPARVTFISPQSQFTPKNVETQTQREDLVFRVKLSVPRDLLQKFEEKIKTGVRGVGFVRTSADAEWPEQLRVNLPE
ncbi:efflux RND transporter periplasmic adaptor subunit [Granulosicoccaceae sp. 1_MG-2023]|nr:efflux RND transporter periplasmic adaptor subunit [Granulosicoccaceae sp. 1_MG-2023]